MSVVRKMDDHRELAITMSKEQTKIDSSFQIESQVIEQLKKIHESIVDLVITVQDLAESFQRVVPKLGLGSPPPPESRQVVNLKEGDQDYQTPEERRQKRRQEERKRIIESKRNKHYFQPGKPSKKKEIPEDQQVQAVIQLLNGYKTATQLSSEYGCTDRTVRRWKQKYEDNKYQITNGYTKGEVELNNKV